MGGMPSAGGLSKRILARIYASFGENFEWLGQQVRLGIEPGTSCLPVLSTATGPTKGGQFHIHALPRTLGAIAGLRVL